MQNLSNTILTLILFLSYTLSFAQPDCAVLVSPAQGAIDQDLTITFEWAAAPTGETPTNYVLFVGEAGGTLTQVFSGAGTTSTISAFFELGTIYEWQVIAENGNGSATGCMISSFTTISIPQPSGVTCGAGATDVTIIEDMESETGWTGDISAATNLTWQLESGTTPSGGTGNTGPQSAHSGTSYFYFEASSSNSETADASLISPMIDLTQASGTVDLSFYMFAYGSGIHSLDVGVSTSATGPFTNLWSWNGPIQSSQTDAWQLVGFDVSAYAGQVIYVEFLHVATATGGFNGDLAVDYLRFDGCEAVTAENNECITALALSEVGEAGELTGQSTEFATDSGLGNASCGGTATKDVYYSIETDDDGGLLEIDIASGVGAKYTIAVYENACGSLVEVACETAAATGSDVNLQYQVPFTFGGPSGNEATKSAPQNLTVRVYDENNADETFDIMSSGAALLPVELLNWKASLNQRSVSLSWSTAQEFNTEKFVIEKSFDGTSWFEMEEINAVGFSNEINHYDIEDFDLAISQMYRLRIIDLDGYTEVSKIISITRDDLNLTIYPNPASEFINLAIEHTEEMEVEVFDMNGKLMINRENSTFSNGNLDIRNLNVGLYRIIVKTRKGVYQSTFMKK